MKAKKTFVLGLVASLIVGAGALAVAASTAEPIHVNQLFADDQRLTLNVDNRVEGLVEELSWSDTTRKYQNGYTTIRYVDACSNDAFHVQLGADGYMEKKEASYGLKTIRVVKEERGTLLIESDYVPTFDSDARFEEWFSGTDETFNVVGNYWRIKNVSGGSTSICISSVEVVYDCLTPSQKSTSPDAGIKEFITYEQAYTIQDLDGTTYFTAKGYLKDNGVLITPDQLYIKDDGSNRIECAFVRYRKDNRFEAFFDLDRFHRDNANYSGDFGVHLFVGEGVAWNGNSSDIFWGGITSETFNTPAGTVKLSGREWNRDAVGIQFTVGSPLLKNAQLSNDNGQAKLLLTGDGGANKNTLGVDVENFDIWTKQSPEKTVTVGNDGSWSINASLSGLNLESWAYDMHFFHNGSSSDIQQEDGMLSDFEPSEVTVGGHTYKLETVRWWKRTVLGLFVDTYEVNFECDLSTPLNWHNGDITDCSFYFWLDDDHMIMGDYDNCRGNAVVDGNLRKIKVNVPSGRSIVGMIVRFYENGNEKKSDDISCTINSAGSYVVDLGDFTNWTGDKFHGSSVSPK